MPLRMGSAAPYSLRRPSILSCCWVASQFFRRASSGWLVLTSAATDLGPALRSVSGTEVADGAPLRFEMEETVDGLPAAGTMRRDCDG